MIGKILVIISIVVIMAISVVMTINIDIKRSNPVPKPAKRNKK